uniref:sensor histidine kinase n=1 Tax=Candidatus Entotheonella palauensis TaxID=93172 RepID=UPI001C4E1BFF
REKSNDLDTLKLYYVCKLFLYHLFGEYQIALEFIDTGHEWVPSRRIRCEDPWIVMLSALHQLANYASVAPPDQRCILAAVDEQLGLLEMWASYGPMNVLHKYHLVQAERLRVLGQTDEAREHYEKAIAGAKAQGFMHEEAMARELTGRFYAAIAHEELAAFYLQGAYRAYAEWGATAKCEHLIQHHPDWLGHMQRLGAPPEDGYATDRISTSSSATKNALPTGTQQLDLDSILKASQAISSELRLDALHNTLLQLTVQNAGAQNGYLLAGCEGQWHVEAACTIDHAPTPYDALSQEPPYSLAIVNYVQRTGETLVLANATQDERFQDDPSVRHRHVLSVVCLSLRRQGERAFMLYLENNLTEHTFTPERVQILEMLMAQVAISLDNAQLYQDLQTLNADLETRVQERTVELQQAQQNLVEQAHRAGMADIAANVLHNVGNVLNNVTTSASVIQHTVGNSQVGKLVQANDMVAQHSDDLDTFIKHDGKAAKLLRYYWLTAQQLLQEQQDVLDNVSLLQDKIQLINEIVVAQQSYAQGGALEEELILEEMVELALTLQGASAERHDVRIERQFSPIAPVRGQKTKLVHVIVNLIKNAIEAMKGVAHDRKHLTLSIEAEVDTAYLRVCDTGCGIAPQMLEAIFTHGTSTKPDGHGFGLHSSANYMKEMGGRLWAESAGEGQGATFIVTLPRFKR